MVEARNYTTRRAGIVDSLVSLLKTINGTGNFRSNLSSNIFPYLKYFSDVGDFPCVCIVAGGESRVYQAGGYKDRYLSIKVIIFVHEENPLTKLNDVLEDIETLLEKNGRLAYLDRSGVTEYTHDITIPSISTDEGTLEPIAIGEMSITVHY